MSASAAILSYLRFVKRWHYAATEVDVPGGARADVLASDGKSLVEFEIKSNVPDVKRDFACKQDKHEVYGQYAQEPVWLDRLTLKRGTRTGRVRKHNDEFYTVEITKEVDGKQVRGASPWNNWQTEEAALRNLVKYMAPKTGVPNKLVYLVHAEIADKALEIIPETYGVTTYTDFRYSNIVVKRQPKVIHKNPVSKDTLDKLVSRMSSELANLHMGTAAYSSFEQIMKESISKHAEVDSDMDAVVYLEGLNENKEGEV